MITITRLTNGNVIIVDDSGPNYDIPAATAGVSKNINQGDIITITCPQLPAGRLAIVRTNISLVNGSAPPATSDLLITLLENTVFFRQAATGGGTTYTQNSSAVPLSSAALNAANPASFHGDRVFLANAKLKYLKVDDSPTGIWDEEPYNITN